MRYRDRRTDGRSALSSNIVNADCNPERDFEKALSISLYG